MSWKWSVPETIVFLIAALLPTYGIRFRIGPVPTTLLEIVVLVGIVLLVFALRFRGGNETKAGNDRFLAIGMAVLVIATLAGIIVAPDARAALGIARAYFWEPMLLSWLLIATKPDGHKMYRALRNGLALAAIVVIAYGFVQYFAPTRIPAPWNTERRITSVFAFPNAVALFLAPTLVLFLTNNKTFVLAPLGGIVIALARSAGGLVASAASIAFYGITRKRWRIATIVITVCAILLIAFAPFANNLREQLLLRDWSGRVHQIGWSESFAMLRAHPVFGAGLSGYPTAVEPYHTAQGVEIFQYPHNFLLTIWSELGALGLVAFALILVWFFSRRNRILPLTAAMIALLIHGLADVPYFKNDLALMFWLFIAIAAIMDKETKPYANT